MKKINNYIITVLMVFIPFTAAASKKVSEEMNYDFNSFLFGKKILFGTFLGFLIGFTIKKSIKILMFLIGIILIIMIFLSKQGVVIINWSQLQLLYKDFFTQYDFTILFKRILIWFKDSIPVAGSFGVGFFIGLKTG